MKSWLLCIKTDSFATKGYSWHWASTCTAFWSIYYMPDCKNVLPGYWVKEHWTANQGSLKARTWCSWRQGWSQCDLWVGYTIKKNDLFLRKKSLRGVWLPKMINCSMREESFSNSWMRSNTTERIIISRRLCPNAGSDFDTHTNTRTHIFALTKWQTLRTFFFSFFLRTSVNKCSHFDFPPCYFFLSLQSGFSGDGKQETGKESSPCVQSAGSTGTQTPKQTVSKICWGTNTASNSLTHNCISYCYCGVTQCSSTLSKLSGKALSVALYSFVIQETLSSSDQTNNITAPARQFALCRSSRHLSCYSVLINSKHMPPLLLETRLPDPRLVKGPSCSRNYTFKMVCFRELIDMSSFPFITLQNYFFSCGSTTEVLRQSHSRDLRKPPLPLPLSCALHKQRHHISISTCMCQN